MNHTAAVFNTAPRVMRPAPEVLEARTALRITAQLGQATDSLPHDVTERLRASRERALEAARHSRRLQDGTAARPRAGASRAPLSGAPPLWLRLASVLPLLVLLAGLFMIQQYNADEEIAVAAVIDSELLADDLPPEAYGDPGFTEYLRAQRTP